MNNYFAVGGRNLTESIDSFQTSRKIFQNIGDKMFSFVMNINFNHINGEYMPSEVCKLDVHWTC